MTPPSLSIVAQENLSATIKPETVAQRVQRLQSEARQLARDHVRSLMQAIDDAAGIAQEVSMGGDAYPAGIRDLAARFVDDSASRLGNLESLLGKLA